MKIDFSPHIPNLMKNMINSEGNSLLKKFGDIAAYRGLSKDNISQNYTTARNDIFQKKRNENCCRKYLRENRDWFIERYTFEELIWMQDFIEFARETDNDLVKLPNGFYCLYMTIRGDPPKKLPDGVCYSRVITILRDAKRRGLENKVISNYFSEHPENIKDLKNMKIPDDLPIDNDAGITIEKFFREALKR